MTNKLVHAARAYLGVKFRHRGRSPVGLDCAGLGWIAYRDCGIELPDFRYYGREPHNDGLIKYLTAALGEPVWSQDVDTDMVLYVGDVIVVRFDREPHHVGIITDGHYGDVEALNVIHADGNVGRVIEQRLAPDMVNRITHVYRKEVS